MVSGMLHTPTYLLPTDKALVYIKQETGWAREPNWIPWRIKNVLPLPGIKPEFFRYPANCLITMLITLSQLRNFLWTCNKYLDKF